MASDITQGFKELNDLLKEISKKVADVTVRDEALNAFAKPIVEEAKRITAKGGSAFDSPTGNISEGIVAEIPDETGQRRNQIEIGWTQKAWYGVKLEKGYKHYAKHVPRQHIKRPHLRPAYNAKKTEGADAAVQVLKRHLDPLE